MFFELGTQRDFEYLLSALPLVFMLSVFPTINEAWTGQLEWQRPLLIAPHEMARMIPDLALSESALRSGRWWTLLTHLCIHRDMDHLWGNLRCLAVNGYTVYRDWGALGMNGVFLLGGVFAGANGRGRAVQLETHLEARIPKAPEQLGPVQVPESARSLWDSVRKATARRAAPVVHTRVEACGASSAISSLMGYGFGVSLSELWLLAQRRDTSWDSALTNSPFLFASFFNLWKSFFFLHSEWRSMHGAEGYTGVDHSGHLTGFITGTFLYVGKHAATWVWRKWNRPPPRGQAPRPPLRSGRRYISASGDIMN